MSLKTWKAEFYPVAPKKSMTTKEAIEHSLAKWIGLRKKNLKKHEVGIFSNNMLANLSHETGFLEIDASSCALCKKFYAPDSVFVDDEVGCPNCPLRNVLGEVCDADPSESPYCVFIENGNPEPMIKALKKALKEHKDEV